MFREVRKIERTIDMNAAEKILSKAEYGVLSTIGEDGYPYGIPLSYFYKDDKIYFHCGVEGHKLENIKYNKKVSFCVVGNTEIMPDKFSTKYESVIVFGVIEEIEQAEKEQALSGLIEKYSPNYIDKGKLYIANSGHKATVLKLSIQHMSGKGRQ